MNTIIFISMLDFLLVLLRENNPFKFCQGIKLCFNRKVEKSPLKTIGLLIFFISFIFLIKIFPIFAVTTFTETITSSSEDVSIYDNTGAGDGEEYTYIKFNIYSIPSNIVIDSVYFSYYPTSRDTKNWDNDANIANTNNQIWTESDSVASIWGISTSNEIAGIDFCNWTDAWQNTTDIKSIFRVDYDVGNENMTLRLHDPDEVDTPDTTRGADNIYLRIGDFKGTSECDFDSSEGTNPPKLYVTYNDTEPEYYDISTNASGNVFINQSIEHRTRWIDNSLSGYVFSWNGTYCNGTWYNDSWSDMIGTGNWSNVTKTISNESCPNTVIGWRIYSNDSIDQWNDTDIQSYNVYNYGYLEVELIYPPPSLYMARYSNITVNATVYCRNGLCGNVQGTVQYNGSSANPDTPVNTTTGDKPFFVQDSPQVALKSCPTNPLSQDGYCNLTWVINATGDVGIDWKIGVLFNSTLENTKDNHTSNSTLTILECFNDISVNWDSIEFEDMLPNTTENSAIGNSNKIYNISSYEWSCVLDIWINGTDFKNTTYNSMIGVGNMSWNKTGDISSTNLTYDYDLVQSDLTKNTNLTTYYWFNLPPVYKGKYNGTLTIKTNDTE